MDAVNEVKNEVATEVSEQQVRTLALGDVLNHAPDLGIEEAMSKFGSALTDTEKEVLKTLTPEEVGSLKSILSKANSETTLSQCYGLVF